MDTDFALTFGTRDLTAIPDVYWSRRFPNEIPSIELVTHDLVRQDGAVTLAKRYGTKGLIVEGVILSTSRTNYEIALDLLKQSTKRLEKDLTVVVGGIDRVYKCTLNNIVHTHVEQGKATVSLIFLCSYPFGHDESLTTNATNALTTSGNTINYLFDGSVNAKPKFTITINSVSYSGTDKGFTIENSVTGQSITVIRTGWTASEVITIDCKLKEVRANGILTDYTGVFPTFEPAVDQAIYSDTFSARNVDIDIDYYREFL